MKTTTNEESLKETFDCPHCGGSGTYTSPVAPGAPPDSGWFEKYDACGCTGKVTREEWNQWLNYLAGDPAPARTEPKENERF
jgi:hypothetical protein